MSNNNQTIEMMLGKFMPFAQQRMGFETVPQVRFENDEANAQNPLGKTAYYEPDNSSITVYTVGRHPKDIMRSISHELVHHAQNGRGEFANSTTVGEQGYAQNDDHLREMEREAYEQGNLCFRDWEDSVKTQNEELNMFEKRNKKLNERMMKKYGYTNEAEWARDDAGTYSAGDEAFAQSKMQEPVDRMIDRLVKMGFSDGEATNILWVVQKYKSGDVDVALAALEDEGSIDMYNKLREVFGEDCPGDDPGVANCIVKTLVAEFSNVASIGEERGQPGIEEQDSGYPNPLEEIIRKIADPVQTPPTSLYKKDRMVDGQEISPLAAKAIVKVLDLNLQQEIKNKFLNLPVSTMTEVAFNFTDESSIANVAPAEPLAEEEPTPEAAAEVAPTRKSDLAVELEKLPVGESIVIEREQGENKQPPDKFFIRHNEDETYSMSHDFYRKPKPSDHHQNISLEDMSRWIVGVEKGSSFRKLYTGRLSESLRRKLFEEEEKSEAYWAELDKMQAQHPDKTIPEIEDMMGVAAEEPSPGNGGEEYNIGDTVKDNNNKEGEVLELTAYGAIAQFEGEVGPRKVDAKDMTKTAASGSKELAKPELGDEMGLSEKGDYGAIDVDLSSFEDEFPDALDGGGEASDVDDECRSQFIKAQTLMALGKQDAAVTAWRQYKQDCPDHVEPERQPDGTYREPPEATVMTQEADISEEEDPYETRDTRLHEKLTKWSIK